MELTEQQITKLQKLAKVLDGGDIELLAQIDELESKIQSEIQEIKSTVNEALNIAERTKKLTGEKGRDGYNGKDGKDGKDYTLTTKDKKEIAKSIEVPIVEKVIEKTTVKEVPIITNEIVEVAVLDVDRLPQYGEKYRDGLELIIAEEDKLKQSAIQDLPKDLEEIRKDIKSQRAGGGLTRSAVVTLIGSSSFETVAKNLNAKDATLNYTGDNLTSIVYVGGITKTLNYTGENLTSVVLSGTTPSGIELTKTLVYTGENLTGVLYS